MLADWSVDTMIIAPCITLLSLASGTVAGTTQDTRPMRTQADQKRKCTLDTQEFLSIFFTSQCPAATWWCQLRKLGWTLRPSARKHGDLVIKGSREAPVLWFACVQSSGIACQKPNVPSEEMLRLFTCRPSSLPVRLPTKSAES